MSTNHSGIFTIPDDMPHELPTPTTPNPAGSGHSPPRGCPLQAFAARTGSGKPLSVAGVFTMLYGVLAYAAFLITILYAIGFVSNAVVPKTINSGVPRPLAESLLINAAILLLFVAQHTVMARPVFKRLWTRVIPPAIERSTFVIAASLCLGLVFWLWRPLPREIWHVAPPWSGIITAVSFTGWGIVFASSFMVSHWDLFGLRQTWSRLLGRTYTPVGFRLVGFYRLVRHPLMVGFLIAFWATPVMTVGHLFFAVMVTGYIIFGVWMEERDLVAHLGDEYTAYRRRVRALLPIPRRAD